MYCQIVIVVTIHEIIDFSGLKTSFSLKRNLTLVFHNREENLFINTVLLFKFITSLKTRVVVSPTKIFLVVTSTTAAASPISLPLCSTVKLPQLSSIRSHV